MNRRSFIGGLLSALVAPIAAKIVPPIAGTLPISNYASAEGEIVTRLDILYGYCFVKPEWCVAIGEIK